MLTHGPFWLSLPEAAEIEAKARQYLDGTRRPEERQAARTVIDAFQGRDEVLDPDDQAALSDNAQAAEGKGEAAELGEKVASGAVWNILGTIGRKFRRLVGNRHTEAILAGVAASAIFAWLTANQVAISIYLRIAQGTAEWFTWLMEGLKRIF